MKNWQQPVHILFAATRLKYALARVSFFNQFKFIQTFLTVFEFTSILLHWLE